MLSICATDGLCLCHDSRVTAERDEAATERYESAETLTEWQLAKRFRKTVWTIRRWRQKKMGPPHFKDPGGTVWYSVPSMLAWQAEQEAATAVTPIAAQPPARPGTAEPQGGETGTDT